MRTDLLSEITTRAKLLTAEEYAWLRGWINGYELLGQPTDPRDAEYLAGYWAGARETAVADPPGASA